MKCDLETYIFEYYFEITKSFHPYEYNNVLHNVSKAREKSQQNTIFFLYQRQYILKKEAPHFEKVLFRRVPLIQKHIHIDNSVCKGYIFKLVSAWNGNHEQLPIGTGITCPDKIMMQSDIWDIDL